MPPNDSGYHSQRPTLNQILTAAITELSETGYISPERIDFWLNEIRRAADMDLGPESFVDRDTRAKLSAVYDRLIERGKINTYVPGVTRFDLSMIRPELRAELDRRILASADLIKLHRREAVEHTLQRFRGWSTSIPPGGDGSIDKRETRTSIGKSVAQVSFERRRVDIDQGHKLIANISEIVATDAGAIAGIWHSHGEHDRSYNARKEHLARAEHIFVVRDNWAMQKRLMKLGGRVYMDEIERPGQLPYCRCFYTWITSPRRLPDEMLTRLGQEFVAQGMRRAA